jgi:oxepin-CoA hydrolase/3-oxo-5,6-dehydrosuberyl-CoA semialdehyde dehydrogenase
MALLQSYIADRWLGGREGTALASAIDGSTIHHAHADEIDFAEALAFARRRGGPALLALDFQERAARLKALAAHVNERKETLYAISRHTGATRSDGWVDIEGGTGTLYAYASMGGNELPSGNVLPEGPPVVLGKKGHFAATHILVPRGGVAVHINAFNFPVWGLLEKFAPTFLAGMPTIAKPATSTSYLTEAMVRLVAESGILPAGALQLVVGGTGDLLDRLGGQDVVTFTGSADTAATLRVHPNLIGRSVPFNAEADSLNAALLGPDVSPDDPEFDLFVREVAREMTAKAGQKCTAIRRAIVPRRHLDALAAKLADRLAKTTVGDPAIEGVKMGALRLDGAAGGRRRAPRAGWRAGTRSVAPDDGFAPQGRRRRRRARSSRRTLVLCRDGSRNDAVHDCRGLRARWRRWMPVRRLRRGRLALAARGPAAAWSRTLVNARPEGRRQHAIQRRWPRGTGRLLVLEPRLRSLESDGPWLAAAGC